MTAQTPEPPKPFDPDAAHQQRPRLRRLRTFPMPVKGPDGQQQVLLGLADAQQISDKVVATHPAVQHVLPLMDGSRDLDQIVSEVGRGLERNTLETIVAQLDGAALLFGPPFETIEAKMKSDFDSAQNLPPASSAQLVDSLAKQKLGEGATEEQIAAQGPAFIGELFDQWIDKALENADNPSFDALPPGVVVPGNDYGRSWINYAAVWGRLRVVDRPDRVVVLGTNHFGSATGVCGCDKGFETPLGLCELDQAFVHALDQRLGAEDSAKLYEHRFDHEREHSIELQVPWIQHCLGAGEDGSFVPVFGVLVHDPVRNSGESYDGAGLGLDPFIEAMKGAIADAPGTTLLVAAADLSHVGPMFGDQQSLSGEEPEAVEARNQVARQDQELLKHLVEGRPDDLVSSLAWSQNASRWASTGALVALSKILDNHPARVLNYAASLDPQGTAMLTNAAMVVDA